MPKTETLPLLLKQLGLSTMFEKWEDTEKTAQEKQWRHADYLSTLCEFEAANRYQKRVVRHTQRVEITGGKNIGHFRFFSDKISFSHAN